MFDLGWTELVVVAVVAILVVGPKQLPGMLRSVGKSIGSVRRMAGDFQRQFNDALKEADLDDMSKTVTSINSINPTKQIKDSLNPLKQAAADVERDINKGLLKPAKAVETLDAKPDTAAKSVEAPEAPVKDKPSKAKPAKAKPAKAKTAKSAPAKTAAKAAKPDISGDAS